ncbi:MAG: hypothetical protein N2255_06285 [Kiritimatiellae bacterium]|nr:hypothetical protein [Kiritimatiellia bacterium]
MIIRLVALVRTILATFTILTFGHALVVPDLVALESDQYYAWGYPLEDSTDVLNAKFNLEIKLALDEINRLTTRRNTDCDAMARAVRGRLQFLIFQPVELWALNTPLLSRFPATHEENLIYRRTNLYHRRGLLDPSGWIPNVPTIEVNGIRFGPDKLSHSVSSGWRYYRRYLRKLRQGATPEEAEKAAIDHGILGERGILGCLTTGVLSLADLEADYQGMKFYQSLCSGENPILEYRNGYWRQRRLFDIRQHVTPEWDESYQVPIFTPKRWRRVKPVLERYRERLALPGVTAQRNRYRALDSQTATERMLAQLVAQGKLPDPRTFSLENDVPEIFSNRQANPIPRSPNVEQSALNEQTVRELMAVIHQQEQDRIPNVTLVIGIHAGYPELLGATLGGIITSLPRTYDGVSLARFEGPLIQAEAGLHTGRLSLGWAHVFGEKRWGKNLLSDVYLGYAFKAALLRTWGNPPSDVPTDNTFLGLEAEGTIVRVNFRLGLFHSLDDDFASPWLVTGGIGYGF